MGKAHVQPDYSTTATFEQIWTILERTAKRQEEIAEQQKETDRIVKDVAERQKETDRQQKETDRIVTENARQIGKLGNRFGEWVEYMVLPNLVQKFNELNFVFTKAYPHATIEDEKNNIIAEIDITLENGDKVMIVEVKSKPSSTDVKDHVERMKKVRHHADLHDDKRKYLGAVAGMVITKDTREFILKSGFYVIEPSGETFVITPPNGKPKEW
jgi:hypothetical protein